MDDSERSKLLKAFVEKPSVLVDFIEAGNESAKFKLETDRAKITAWLDEQKSIGVMRQQWSRWLLLCIVAVIFFDFIFITLLGFKILSFYNQKVILSFIGENLIKIAGLAYIVVNFLFDRNRDISR